MLKERQLWQQYRLPYQIWTLRQTGPRVEISVTILALVKGGKSIIVLLISR